ncbi:alpha-mannosidase [Paenibacillus alginolyticus]|uniref:Alpha-mannosidase n=1 Tax=Paenibacillus alginolyticus TaxID=59839 RepID=A0ABT4GMF5_9BACL|nr:alpha-mannosidase [Paenibacillus alginolyticus]MCY9697393.1 alpha-mannosidase [Paenibacillus alginolyticus]MEC0146241.1 alpha-mannosidase [Paenibacillus alginolyticus]
MFFTIEKLGKRVQELEPFRYRDKLGLNGLRIKEEIDTRIGLYPDEGGEWKPIACGERWQGFDQYFWLAADVQIPEQWKGHKMLGYFDMGVSGREGISGFESLLFVNGAPYQGLDTNHKEVFLDPKLAGSSVALRFRMWTGLNGYNPSTAPIEYTIKRLELCWLDEPTDDLYFTAKAVLQTLKVLNENQPEFHTLLKMLDRAFLCIDWSRPGSDAFYRSVQEAANRFREQLQNEPKTHAVVVQCIGHTHIDVAWLWRLEHTREKAARSFSTVLRLMEQYPEYVFLQTQPQLYEYLQQDYPELYEQIRKRAAEGQWEAGGAMWLEADCNLSSGESLVRHILYGTRFLQKEFGVNCTYLWLPDVFGYSWSLPQILKKSGISTFMTTKISWNQYNRMPNDTFVWRGIDGSEIITHFITTPDPGRMENGAFFYTYNGGITADSVQGIWDGYRDKGLNQKLLLAYGYGDGGGGVNREMLEMRRRLSELPGLPQVTTGRADQYFAELEQTVRDTDQYVHTWDGELYLELHRGTYTSQAYNKRMNRKLELLYRDTEFMQVLGGVCNQSFVPSTALNQGWKIILRNQFHDIIPGSSIREVYEDSRVEYNEALEIAEQSREEAAHFILEQQERSWTVFNSASWTRSDHVWIPFTQADEQGRWLRDSGEICPSQRTVEGWLVYVTNLPSMGFAAIRYEKTAVSQATMAEAVSFYSLAQGIETPFYILQWNNHGQLTRIYDKQAVREVLKAQEAGNVFEVFEDKPKSRHEAWDIDLYYLEKRRVIDNCTQVQIVEIGPLRAVVQFSWTYMDSELTQKMVLYADNRRIDFETKVEWHEQRQLLKVAFPVDIRSTEATYDIQFGNVKRPTHWNTSWDYARFETVGHQWADLSERGYGISLMNDCKYGYDIKDHLMRLTLIKSAMVPDPTADQGEHIFCYSLYPHQGDWFAGKTVQAAWHLNSPLIALRGLPVKDAGSLFSVNADHVCVDAVKLAEDGEGFIVRMHEYGGARGPMKLASEWSEFHWQETDMLENPLPGEGLSGQGSIQCDIGAYEIKTFRIQF